MEFIQEKKEIPINSSQEDAPTSNLNPLDRKTTTGYVHPRERLAYGARQAFFGSRKSISSASDTP